MIVRKFITLIGVFVTDVYRTLEVSHVKGTRFIRLSTRFDDIGRSDTGIDRVLAFWF